MLGWVKYGTERMFKSGCSGEDMVRKEDGYSPVGIGQIISIAILAHHLANIMVGHGVT